MKNASCWSTASETSGYSFTGRSGPEYTARSGESGLLWSSCACESELSAAPSSSPGGPSRKSRARASAPAEKRPTAKLCVIDDNPERLGDFKRILSASGYQILVISRLIGASNQIREHQPDLLLINANMASLSAETILAVLVKNLKVLPVTIIYADLDPETLEPLALKSRADAYISEKGGYTQLMSRIRYYVRLLGKN